MKIKAIRTNCTTGEEKKVEVEIEIIKSRDNKEDILKIVKGGVTGYESFCISGYVLDSLKNKRYEWYACAGTRDRWDTLYIPSLRPVIKAWENKKFNELTNR